MKNKIKMMEQNDKLIANGNEFMGEHMRGRK